MRRRTTKRRRKIKAPPITLLSVYSFYFNFSISPRIHLVVPVESQHMSTGIYEIMYTHPPGECWECVKVCAPARKVIFFFIFFPSSFLSLFLSEKKKYPTFNSPLPAPQVLPQVFLFFFFFFFSLLSVEEGGWEPKGGRR